MTAIRRRRLAVATLVAAAIAGAASIGFPTDATAASREQNSAALLQRFFIRWLPDPSATNKSVVEVSGLSAAILQRLQQTNWSSQHWQQLLSVYAEQGDLIGDVNLPPMLGAYRVQSGGVRFEPRFPFEPDMTYRAVFRPSRLPGDAASGAAIITAVFRTPTQRAAPTTVVKHIYPSAGILPENLLKFYVHFSAPMSRGRIYDHIHLRNEAGKLIELPFLEIDEELWDPSMTRLTLFIDPGRIKRGVRPLEEVGPSLETGKQYVFVIDREWKDASGNPLKEGFQKKFTVGPPDREPPDPARWRIEPPQAGTAEPLAIAFPKPLDHALAQRVIRVTNEAGAVIAGTTSMTEEERRWAFVPSNPWRRGRYQVLVQNTIEDLAGNNIGKAFEVDLFEGVQRRLSHETSKLPFEVR